MPRIPSEKILTKERREKIAAMIRGLRRQRIIAARKKLQQRRLPFDSEAIAEAIVTGRRIASPELKRYRKKFVRSIVRFAAKEAMQDAHYYVNRRYVDLLESLGISLLEAIGMNEIMQLSTETEFEKLLRAIQASSIKAELTTKYTQVRKAIGEKLFDRVWPKFVRYMAEFFREAIQTRV
ncbi:MAG: hypothetical protein J7L14_03940 [Candidatus Diapherotrites archaeon]|nr:hypothetical protein [Candidatus Diapherotrites archaeon]